VIAVGEGRNLVVHSGTGSGKTMAMILPVLLLDKEAVAITVSRLQVIQDNHVRFCLSLGSYAHCFLRFRNLLSMGYLRLQLIVSPQMTENSGR
jgi:hypothetical protein